MRIKNLDLIVAICVVALNGAWTQVPNRPVLIGIILVLPLTFMLPGYTLTQILLRRRSSDQLYASPRELMLRSRLKQGPSVGIVDKIVLSLGLSLAIDVLVGFGLNILPGGLQASSWALALGLLTTVFALLAAFLRHKNSAVRTARAAGFHVTISNGLLLGLAVVVASASVWLAIIRPLNPQPSFTQLWMLPAKNNDCSVSIGIQSFETTSVTYRLVMTINDTQTNNWSSIILSPQQKWSQSVAATSVNANNLHIQALLYRADKPDTIYRNVHITFHVTPIMNAGQLQSQCKLSA
jgi:uncharacterized membrane protein